MINPEAEPHVFAAGCGEATACAIPAAVASHGPGKFLCPSGVARAFDGRNWRGLLPAVRAVALTLAQDARICITQRGRPINLTGPLRGVVRLSLP
jgi:hypothetical protein